MENFLANSLEKQSILNSLNSIFGVDANDNLILSAVLKVHNFMEGNLNLLISDYYFGKERNDISKDKVNHFWVNMLIEMDFAKKVTILEREKILTSKIIKILRRINDIRNDLAHYPHRLHKRKKKHFIYGGKHILKDIEALRMFYSDYLIFLKETNKLINNGN